MIRSRWAIFGLLFFAMALLGCWRTPVVAPVPTPAPPVKPVAPKIDLSEEPPEPEPIDVAQAEPAATNAVEEPAANPRFLLLTSASPLVVELSVTINDQPFEKRLEELVERTLALADVDGNGVPTWDEAFSVDVIKTGLLGNVALPNEDARAQARRLYDIDSDDRVDADELPRFLTRNAGGSRALSLRSFPSSPGYTAGHSPLRKILDINRDGAIDQTEWQAASTQLLLRDANDDGALAGIELQPLGAVDEAAANRGTGPRTAFLLEEAADFRRIDYAMQESFGYGSPPREDGFSACPELFTHLDADQSGEIERKEWPRLITAPPQLRIAIAFFDDGVDTVTIESISQALAETVSGQSESPGAVSLALPGGKLNLFVNDQLPAGEGITNQAQQLLSQYDSDENGYIDETEAEAAPMNLSLTAGDANADGKIYLDEIETLLAKRNEVIAAQIRGRAIHAPLPLLAWVDADGDGRLSPQELEQISERLAELDINADEHVTIDEIPTSVEIAFVRGDAEQGQQLFARPALPPKPNAGPAWFVEMDLNRDGLVSTREFVGGRDRFAEFDANDDGFLSVDEIE